MRSCTLTRLWSWHSTSPQRGCGGILRSTLSRRESTRAVQDQVLSFRVWVDPVVLCETTKCTHRFSYQHGLVSLILDGWLSYDLFDPISWAFITYYPESFIKTPKIDRTLLSTLLILKILRSNMCQSNPNKLFYISELIITHPFETTDMFVRCEKTHRFSTKTICHLDKCFKKTMIPSSTCVKASWWLSLHVWHVLPGNDFLGVGIETCMPNRPW